MKKMASFTTCCGCPTAEPSGSRSDRWWGCCPCARPPPSRRSSARSSRQSRSGSAWFLEARPELRASMHDPRQLGVAGRRLMSIMNAGEAPPRAGDDARRERVSEPVRPALHLALSRGASVRHLGRRSSQPGRLSARRVRQRTVRRQLELARPGLDAGQRPDHPGARAVLTNTTATRSRSSVRPARVGR